MYSSWLCSCVVFCVLGSLGWVSFAGAHDHKISTALVARWEPTSLLSEAAEFVSDVDSHLFWSYLENLKEKIQHLPPPNTDDGEMELGTVAAFELLSSSKLMLMEWALRTRAYSPKVVMFQQLAPPEAFESDCEAFVHLGGSSIYCSVDELKNALSKSLPFEEDDEILTVEVDHKYPSHVWNLLSLTNGNSTHVRPMVAVLYGSLTSKNTFEMHQYLKSQVNKVGYIYRPWQKSKNNGEKLRLSGYGVELQFKSQEYKAQDDSSIQKPEQGQEVAGFMFDILQKNHPDKVESLEKFQNHLASMKGRKSEFEALKAWQVQELGLQACYFSTIQQNVLEGLADVSGNFPSRAASLSSIKVPSDFKRAVTFNQRILASQFNLDEGEGAFFLQGSFMDPDSIDLFNFMDTIRTELNFMELVRAVYSDSQISRDRVNTILSLGAKASAEPDFALDMRDSSVYWINDLENDEEYEDWPDDLTQLFFRMGGVMLRPVRRNVFNLLITVDPEDLETTSGLLKMAQSFMAHKSPVRIGVVFSSSEATDESDGELSNTALLRRIMNYALSESQGRVRRAFNDIVEALSTNDFKNLQKRYALVGEEFDFGAQLARDFIKKSGRPTPGAFLNGVPLKWDSPDDFEEVVLNQLIREAQSVQIDAYNGKVRDSTDIFDYLMNKANVLSRLNDKILDISNSKYISFGTEIWESGKSLKNQYANLASRLNYLTPSGRRKTPVTVSIWVFADIGTKEGQKYLANAVEFLSESSTHSRLAFIPTDAGISAFKDKVLSAINENDVPKLKKILEEFSDERTEDERASATDINDLSATFMRLAGVPVGGKGLVVNGRIIGPLAEEDTFEVGDWALVEKFSFDSCARFFDSDDRDADAIMRMCATLGNPSSKTKHSKRFTMPDFQKPVLVDTKVDPNDVFYVDLVAVVDPASRSGHKMAALMSALKLAVGQWTKIQIVFNTQSKNSELPLKSYFRFVAGQRAQEDVVFENIPQEPLFTQNMIAPDNWMVEVTRGIYDLDNIRLSDLGSSVDSEYELEYILVEGHCLELKTGTPPRGLQFTLTPQNEAQSSAETIVMANLGYFQLKAEPGVWNLALRDGPSQDIFSLENYNNKPVTVHSFQSVVIKVKVKRNPGKETVSLLDSEEESSGDGWFGFGSKKKEVEDEVINVFSVASGHLYERLLRIMMLSVLKNTQSRVKFWFLKNYLSPPFKDLLPALSEKYGFEYELVQYHWPRWLNAQREKQRIIWGYKILFLDVLFPLSLKKIVFIDADQIVRTDMKELFELDLEGNPYGYTPFCDSRTDMEGFRFWKQGYWRSHLGKRKYHISALYVVDLVRFRRVAAGDRLRGQYQALSQDPNSLSNLDQDLPNNMIYQVGIKSLPQEWLWCETWCDQASKKNAKTIDLCNNPQTKEPKLEAAQRIVPEWKDYDQELRTFIQEIQSKSTTINDSASTKSQSTRRKDEDHHTEL